jgi:hypothetical protein
VGRRDVHDDAAEAEGAGAVRKIFVAMIVLALIVLALWFSGFSVFFVTKPVVSG